MAIHRLTDSANGNSPIHQFTDSPPAQLDLASRWILSRLSATVDEVNTALDDYRFNDAANNIYQFVWHEFCDWYIEMSKAELGNPKSEPGVMWCLLHTLETSLRLLHPFMPYVTEEIWQNLPKIRAAGGEQRAENKESIVISDYPKSLPRNEKAEAEMSYVIEAVTGIRTIKGELNIPLSAEVKVSIKTFSDEAADTLKDNLYYIRKLSRAAEIEIGRDITKPMDSAACVRASMEIYIPLKGLLNIDTEIDRHIKEMKKVDEAMAFLDSKLLSEDFLQRAPEAVVKKEKAKYGELAAKKERIKENIKKLKEMAG